MRATNQLSGRKNPPQRAPSPTCLFSLQDKTVQWVLLSLPDPLCTHRRSFFEVGLRSHDEKSFLRCVVDVDLKDRVVLDVRINDPREGLEHAVMRSG